MADQDSGVIRNDGAFRGGKRSGAGRGLHSRRQFTILSLFWHEGYVGCDIWRKDYAGDWPIDHVEEEKKRKAKQEDGASALQNLGYEELPDLDTTQLGEEENSTDDEDGVCTETEGDQNNDGSEQNDDVAARQYHYLKKSSEVGLVSPKW